MIPWHVLPTIHVVLVHNNSFQRDLRCGCSSPLWSGKRHFRTRRRTGRTSSLLPSEVTTSLTCVTFRKAAFSWRRLQRRFQPRQSCVGIRFYTRSRRYSPTRLYPYREAILVPDKAVAPDHGAIQYTSSTCFSVCSMQIMSARPNP